MYFIRFSFHLGFKVCRLEASKFTLHHQNKLGSYQIRSDKGMSCQKCAATRILCSSKPFGLCTDDLTEKTKQKTLSCSIDTNTQLWRQKTKVFRENVLLPRKKGEVRFCASLTNAQQLTKIQIHHWCVIIPDRFRQKILEYSWSF